MAHTYYHGPSQPAPRGILYSGQTILVNQHNVQVERYLSQEHYQGGFAHVYVVQSAVPIDNNSRHVLKRIAVADQNMLREVQKEVEVMRKLSGHPNIVKFIDASWHTLPNGTYEVFILMELCAGGGMIDMMNRRLRERLTEAEILRIFTDVCEGVAVMHNQNPPLLHRDLKIENILQASPDLYKLCDFGSAVPVPARHPSSVQELRELEADLGRHTTLQYRAPEMVDVYQRRPVDQKSDIWALGVLLYKLCYYTTPFEEHGPLAILNVQYRIPPYPVYSRELNALIASMLRELGSQRPSVFELLNTVHQLRGTKSRFHYVVTPQRPISFRLQSSSIPQKAGPGELLTTHSSSGQSNNVTSIPHSLTPESIIPMRRGRPIPTPQNSSPVPPKEEKEASKESRNPWHTSKPVITQHKLDDAWLVPGSGNKKKPEETVAVGFSDSFSAVMTDKISPRHTAIQPVLPSKKVNYPKDAFDGLAIIPRTQAAPTLGEVAQNYKTGLNVRDKPPPIRGVISRSPLPRPTEMTSGTVSPRMSASRTGLASYRSPSLSVEERFPSLDDLDRSWKPPTSAPRPFVTYPVLQPESSAKVTLNPDRNLLTTPRLEETKDVNSALTKEPSRTDSIQPPIDTSNSPSQISPASKVRPFANSLDRSDKKDIPIGSSPTKYRPSKPALARKRLSSQFKVEGQLVSVLPPSKDWLTGDDLSPNSNILSSPKKDTSALAVTASSKLPSYNVSASAPSGWLSTKLNSSANSLSSQVSYQPGGKSLNRDSNNMLRTRSPEPLRTYDSSSDEAEGPEEIDKSSSPSKNPQNNRRQSSVHDLVDLYGGASLGQQSGEGTVPPRSPMTSRLQNRRTSETLIDISIPPESASNLLSPPIASKSRAESHSRSRSSSPNDAKFNQSKDLFSKPSPTSSTNERRDKRPQSMFIFPKSKPDAPALLQLPTEEPRPKRAGRRSSISDMVDLYENLVISSKQKIPPPVAQKPSALKGKTPSPVHSRFPVISPISPSTSSSSKPLNPPTFVKPIPRRAPTFDSSIEDKMKIPMKEDPDIRSPPNRRRSVSPHSGNSMLPTKSLSVQPSPTSESIAETSSDPIISSPAPERPYQGVSQLISQWQRKTEEAEASRQIATRARPFGVRPLRGRG